MTVRDEQPAARVRPGLPVVGAPADGPVAGPDGEPKAAMGEPRCAAGLWEEPANGLHAAAAELRALASGIDATLAAQVGAVVERLGQGRFEIAVAGSFNRGKSTLLNALVGAEVLPVGVVPLTAVTTELCSGAGSPEVVTASGSRCLAPGETLADVVTEAGNPGNHRGVSRVVVPVEAPLLWGGLVLVDTPGTGSVNRHNDEEAARELVEADGAIVVLSADSPLADDDRAVLATLRERHAPTFYVCNKADHLDARQLEEVRSFVEARVAAEVGRPGPLWCISARAALQAALAGDPPETAGFEYREFLRALTTFARRDLIGARHERARWRLVDICDRLADHLILRQAAASLHQQELATAIVSVRDAARVARQGLADDTHLLRRDVAALVDQVGRDLAGWGAAVPPEWSAEIAATSHGVGKAALARVLADAVEQTVRTGFEDVRRRQDQVVARGWAAMAERAARRTEARVNTLRRHATSIFDAPLAPVTIPDPTEQPPRFSYDFRTVETPGDQIAALGRLLVPAGVLRRRLVVRAQRQLCRELDKHAGRARADLAQRLQAAGRQLEEVLAGYVDATVDAVLTAAECEEHLRQEQASGQGAEHDGSDDARCRPEQMRRLEQIRAALEQIRAALEQIPEAPELAEQPVRAPGTQGSTP